MQIFCRDVRQPLHDVRRRLLARLASEAQPSFSLAEGEFFPLRWSARVLDEVERAITRSYAQKQIEGGAERAANARRAMEHAFEEAVVTGY